MLSQYLITGRLGDSCFNLILVTGTILIVLSSDRKTPIMKESLNKSASSFEISFFKRNNIL